jgi:toxin HigB-1
MSVFKDAITKALSEGKCPKGVGANLVTPARRKIQMVLATTLLSDLRVPPANDLHALTGDREGQHAIKGNDQYRICFVWTATGAQEIEFVDYH